MKKLFYLLMLPALAFATLTDKSAIIKGHINLIKPVEWIYLRYNTITVGSWVTDSARVVNGEFSLSVKIPDASLASLFIYQGNERKMETVDLFLEPGNIKLTIKDSLKAMKVEGSKAHKEYLVLKERVKPFQEKQNELYQLAREMRKNKDEEGLKTWGMKWQLFKEEINEKVYAAYILENPKSSIAEHILTNYIGSWISVETERLEKARALLSDLPEATKNSPSVKEFSRRLNAALSTAIGKPAIDFTLNDTLGNPVTLSSFRGNYVFIDFWASWCVPCRANNPNLIKAFNRFKNKNFVILGIALDKTNYKAWLDAIHTDKLPWINLIDSKYPADPTAVANLYNIGSIPRSVLVDPSGKIIAKDIEGENGKDIAEKLAVLLAPGTAQVGKTER